MDWSEVKRVQRGLTCGSRIDTSRVHTNGNVDHCAISIVVVFLEGRGGSKKGEGSGEALPPVTSLAPTASLPNGFLVNVIEPLG